MKTIGKIAAVLSLIGWLLVTVYHDRFQMVPPPLPQEFTSQDITFPGKMFVANHKGPKAQAFIGEQKKPLWFSNVRDLFSYTKMPEESQDIKAMYVTDMGQAITWDDLGSGVWIDAKTAYYVIASTRVGGMGGDEAVPFGEKTRANTFIQQYGGRLVRFDAMPETYIFHGKEGVPHDVTH